MIVKAYDLQKFEKKNKKIFLFYGENEGYKNYLIKEVFIDNFKGEIKRFEENEVLNNFEEFISSLINKSFFEQSKLIIIFCLLQEEYCRKQKR